MRKQSGFSLVELSIVLVILGLLVGGVLAGQSLIRAAELRAVSTEYSRWVAATRTFQDKYFALPGDMTNATAFWGAADASGPGGSCASPHTNAGTGTQTCNGNGNGMIGYSYPGSTVQVHNETFRFWQHLANAGLVEGQFTGIAEDAGYRISVGGNAPRSRVSGGTWESTRARNPGEAAADASGIVYGHILRLGAPTAFAAGTPLFRPEEVWGVDTKMDDGLARQGSVITYEHNTCANGASISDLSASYRLDSTSRVCTVMFVRAF